jgi:polyferredoxin
MLRIILIIILFFLLLGALPAWPYSGTWGYYPSGGLGLLLIVLLVLYVVDRRGLP